MQLIHLMKMTITGLLATLLLTPLSKARDGDLDPTFGSGGQVTTDFHQSADAANAIALQIDGKLVVGGSTFRNNDSSGEDFALARYNPDGTLDRTFGKEGKVSTDFPDLAAEISAIAIQPDGRILAAGGFPGLRFSR